MNIVLNAGFVCLAVPFLPVHTFFDIVKNDSLPSNNRAHLTFHLGYVCVSEPYFSPPLGCGIHL